jgi:hypothetical protein
MKTNWIGIVVLVVISAASGLFLSQMREQVFGQPVGFSTGTPQVTVQQQPELPKWCVDFVTLPLPGEHLPRIRVVTVVDTETKRIAVYHMELATGSVRLLSVRDIQPDLMLNQFNAKPPFPNEIMREIQRAEVVN